MPNEHTEQGLLTPRQVAERLGVTNRTLWRLAKQDGFPQPVRFSRKLVRWKVSEVQHYIDTLQPDGRSNCPVSSS